MKYCNKKAEYLCQLYANLYIFAHIVFSIKAKSSQP